jgi:hypothetical protein
MNAAMRKSALRRYVVFRVKAMEFLDIAALRNVLNADQLSMINPAQRKPSDFAEGLRTVLLSWFALFIDTNGMNVIELWTELFPQYQTEMDEVWRRIEPIWKIIKTFRDRAGFHADTPRRFFEARHLVIVQTAAVEAALQEFRSLLIKILKGRAAGSTGP